MSGIRILVPIKRVLDYTLKPRITSSTIDLTGLKHSLNPFDELAIEEAVRLRERASKSTAPSSASPPKVLDILAVSIGPPKTADVLRTAMAMGADRALHISLPEKADAAAGAADDGGLEPLAVAKVLAKVAADERADVIICGKQSISDDSAQTGPMVAALLGWAQATQIASLEFVQGEGNGKDGEGGAAAVAEIVREVDGGTETVRARTPFVVTTDLRLNVPRYASLPNIMKAKKKPLVRKPVEEFGVEVGPRLRTVKVEEPPARKGGVKVEDVDGMISKLKELGAL